MPGLSVRAALELDASKMFPGDATESWVINLTPQSDGGQPRYDGTATQTFVTTEMTCRSVYFAT